MLYRLEHDSEWTLYTVDWYTSVEACEADIERLYGVRGVHFKLNDAGVLQAIVFADEDIVLKLHEVKEAAL